MTILFPWTLIFHLQQQSKQKVVQSSKVILTPQKPEQKFLLGLTRFGLSRFGLTSVYCNPQQKFLVLGDTIYGQHLKQICRFRAFELLGFYCSNILINKIKINTQQRQYLVQYIGFINFSQMAEQKINGYILELYYQIKYLIEIIFGTVHWIYKFFSNGLIKNYQSSQVSGSQNLLFKNIKYIIIQLYVFLTHPNFCFKKKIFLEFKIPHYEFLYAGFLILSKVRGQHVTFQNVRFRFSSSMKCLSL
eukprot:TRINITY_DN6387_c0_g2_i1.p2 TRINITY_DN6387_c0_g2~~TRINITY_DN6387_c0_g2_i1.p2  ORF type:complete len:247 (-),score=-19.31 TRINITY_DN6387_c0_g2_i1:268-1008(-)